MNKVIDVRVVKLYENMNNYRIYIDKKYASDFSVDIKKKIVVSRANWLTESIFDLLENVHIRNEATQKQKKSIYKNYVDFIEKYSLEECI